MENICSLTHLDTGEYGKVLKISAEDSQKHRLYDIGLIPGTVTECVLNHKKGEISAYKIRGAVMALRYEDTDNILISKLLGGDCR